MIKNRYLLIFCSCPDDTVAKRLAELLVRERMAACVTRIPGAESVYVWEGRMQRETEVLLLIKTTAERLATLSARIAEVHPYEVPEIVAVGIDGGSERYLAWLGQTVAAEG